MVVFGTIGPEGMLMACNHLLQLSNSLLGLAKFHKGLGQVQVIGAVRRGDFYGGAKGLQRVIEIAL